MSIGKALEIQTEMFKKTARTNQLKSKVSEIKEKELNETETLLLDLINELEDTIKMQDNFIDELLDGKNPSHEEFKKKALKYIVNSKMDTEDLNLFKEIFSTYLK